MACVVIARNGLYFKPLFAMTNRKSYQRTMPTIIHLNSIFVTSPQGRFKESFLLTDFVAISISCDIPKNDNFPNPFFPIALRPFSEA